MSVHLDNFMIGTLVEFSPEIAGSNIVPRNFPSRLIKTPYKNGNKQRVFTLKVHTETYALTLADIHAITYSETVVTLTDNENPFVTTESTIKCVIESYTGECDLRDSGDIELSLVERSAGVYNPYDVAGETSLKVQLHCHTTGSDGTSTPQEIVDAYVAAGYNALMITDHDAVTVQPASAMIAISGQEVSGTPAHFTCANSQYARGSEENRQNLINGILANASNRSLVLAAHPNLNSSHTYAQLAALIDFDGIEVYNHIASTAIDSANAHGFSTAIWDQLLTNVSPYLIGVAADDTHSLSDYLQNVDGGRMHVWVNNSSMEDILYSIRKGRFVADARTKNITFNKPTVVDNIISVCCPGAYGINFVSDLGVTPVVGPDATYTILGTEKYVRIEAIGEYLEGFTTLPADSEWGNTGGGTWNISSGRLRQQTAVNNPYYYICKTNLQGDFEISGEVQTAAEGDFVYCYKGVNSYYMAYISVATNLVRLYKVWGGASSQIGNSYTPNPALNNTTTYCVKITHTAAGAHTLKVWVKGQSEPADPQVTATDTAYDEGFCGFKCKNATYYDNYYIKGTKAFYQPIVING